MRLLNSSIFPLLPKLFHFHRLLGRASDRCNFSINITDASLKLHNIRSSLWINLQGRSTNMGQHAREMLLIILVAFSAKGISRRPYYIDFNTSYCLSWRLAVEANNVRPWRTAPTQCLRHIEIYMLGGQYERDVELIVEQMKSYVDEIVLSGDGMDAWILDVDDTCISNIFYYRLRRYGCEPYDPMGFRTWAMKGGCPAIQPVLGLFSKLTATGFKVFLITGRDGETLGQATLDNLRNQGFAGYERLIMRNQENRGKSAITYKAAIRKQLTEEGYRIWGNVGDQWSDLQGESSGNRTFKIPNPMYFVP